MHEFSSQIVLQQRLSRTAVTVEVSRPSGSGSKYHQSSETLSQAKAIYEEGVDP